MNCCSIEHLEPRRLLASTLRVDVGGDGYVEASGKTWQADRGFTGGVTSTSFFSVAGTSEDRLFNTRRIGDFAYSLAVANGDYRVKFLFVDPVFSDAGRRQFDVYIERQLMLHDFDIAAVAGRNSAVIKTVNATVSDGRMNIWFDSTIDNAILSGIEITPAPAGVISWRAAAPAPVTKFESNADAVDGKLYVLGGYINTNVQATARVDVYDPATDTWTPRGDMPEELTHSGTASDFSYIYLAGGYVGDWKGIDTPVSRHVWRYDTAADTWTAMLPLPVARAAGALVRAGRKLHFFGGLDLKKRDHAEHYVLDLRHPTVWQEAPPMPNPRNHLGYVESNGFIYAVGGQHRLDEDNGNDTAVDAFDVINGTWQAVASLPAVRSHTHISTLVLDGKIITAGGSTTHHESVDDVLQYDPATDRWTRIGYLPAPRSAGVVKLINGRLIVTGGIAAGQVSKLTWVQA